MARRRVRLRYSRVERSNQHSREKTGEAVHDLVVIGYFALAILDEGSILQTIEEAGGGDALLESNDVTVWNDWSLGGCGKGENKGGQQKGDESKCSEHLVSGSIEGGASIDDSEDGRC